MTCNTTSGYGTTQTIDDSGTVGVYVKLCDEYGRILIDTNVPNRTRDASVTLQYDSAIAYTSVDHKANGSRFYTSKEFAP